MGGPASGGRVFAAGLSDVTGACAIAAGASAIRIAAVAGNVCERSLIATSSPLIPIRRAVRREVPPKEGGGPRDPGPPSCSVEMWWVSRSDQHTVPAGQTLVAGGVTTVVFGAGAAAAGAGFTTVTRS
jgi:hypothetical protein